MGIETLEQELCEMREKGGKRDYRVGGESNYRIGIMWDEREIQDRDKINYRVELSGMREKSGNKDDRNLGRWIKSEIWEDD